jgi:hypothetical protein
VFQQKAYSLMTSKEAKQAFDITCEDEKAREEYGTPSLGQCAAGSAAGEAGCGFVSIENGHWDTHARIR